MNLVCLEEICKSYSEKNLLNNINLTISEGEKIGVLGINGTGKSTLLKIIAGIEQCDKGKITKSNNINIEYLSQNPDSSGELTVLEQVFKGSSPLMIVIREYEQILERVLADPENKNLQNEMMLLNSKMDILNGWQVESEAKAILTKIGINNFEDKISTLSGGQRKRVALASALISECDLLILDEPTNHMDNATISWLEEYLNKRKGALIMITHDRYFLDKVTNKIIEVDNGSIFTYNGNYSRFVELKMQREEMLVASERKRMSLYTNELAWIRRGARARTTKQKARIERFENLKDSKLEVNDDKVDFSLVGSRLGKKVLDIDNINKSFGDKTIIKDFSYIFLNGDRVGIIGPNGSGKSTLMNMLNKIIEPDSGSIEAGETVKVGYFSQENERMNENLRVIDYIREEAEYVNTSDGKHITASQMLERFLFTPTSQWNYIAKLSGGEKRRLYLLKILMSSPNVILLDEPTNDLDIETLTILENFLDTFNGTVITVSHDRYFLDRVVDKILSIEDNGKIMHHVGNYSHYEEHKENFVDENENKVIEIKRETLEVNHVQAKEKPLKFTFKEQKEYENIDNEIQNIEEDIEKIALEINNAGSDFVLLQELTIKQNNLENNLGEKMERWVYLNDLYEKINNK